MWEGCEIEETPFVHEEVKVDREDEVEYRRGVQEARLHKSLALSIPFDEKPNQQQNFIQKISQQIHRLTKRGGRVRVPRERKFRTFFFWIPKVQI